MSIETEFHVHRQFDVGIIINGREHNLGTYMAASSEQAKEQCKREIGHAEEFNLWAKEIEQ